MVLLTYTRTCIKYKHMCKGGGELRKIGICLCLGVNCTNIMTYNWKGITQKKSCNNITKNLTLFITFCFRDVRQVQCTLFSGRHSEPRRFFFIFLNIIHLLYRFTSYRHTPKSNLNHINVNKCVKNDLKKIFFINVFIIIISFIKIWFN